MAHSLGRRTILTALAAGVAGCAGGDDTQRTTPVTETSTTARSSATATATSASRNPTVGDVEQLGRLRLASPAFDDGGSIPREYGHDARNVNPPLTIENVPSGAGTLTLVMDDPDAVEPAGEVWLHWLVWNIPASLGEIPEGWTSEDAVDGLNDFGNRGYDGPAPPDGRHTYRFKLYALGTRLDLPDSAGKRAVGEAMRGSVLAQTQLAGSYPP